MSASRQGHFPLKGCYEDETDLLSLLDYDDGMTRREQNSMIFATEMVLPKQISSGSISQWMTAIVLDQFSAHNKTINVGNWSFHESGEFWDPYTVPETDFLEVPIRDVRSRLELKIQIIDRLFAEMSGVRKNAVRVGIVLLNCNSLTQEEVRNVPSIVQQLSSKVKIFTVIFGCKLVEEVVHMTDTLVLPDTEISLFPQHLLMAMCETCVSGWIPFKHTTGLNMLSCFKITDYSYEESVLEALQYCINWFDANIAIIETEEEMFFLQEQLLKQFTDFDLHNITLLIGLTRDLGSYAKRFQWVTSPGESRPLLIDHWLPGQPCTDCKDDDCVVWQFTKKTVRDKDNNSVSEGWININCHSEINSKPLCEVVLPRKIDDVDFAFFVPVPTNITNFAKASKHFMIYENNVVSLSANVPNPNFIQFLQDSNLDFPIFDCGEDVDDRRYISYSMVCDFVDHCRNKRDELLCQNFAEFYYTGMYCASGQKLLSEDQKCDNVKHCRDGSDEGNCFNKDCKSVRCQDSSCLPLQWVNDGHLDCLIYMTSSSERVASDESFHENLPQLNNKSCAFSCNRDMCLEESQLNDSLKDCKGLEGRLATILWQLEPANTCRNKFGRFIWAPKCYYIKDRYGGIIGCRDMSHLRDCENLQCGHGYVKCYNSYCIPHYYLRDGRADCPTGEDEQLFYTGPCIGYFDCWDSNICLHPDLVCDGHTDCPHSDDELDCDVFCPEGFQCIAGTVILSAQRLSVPLDVYSLLGTDPRTTYIDLSGVEILNIDQSVTAIFEVFLNLKVLILSNCSISELPMVTVLSQKAAFKLFVIEKLDISYNMFTQFSTNDYNYKYQYLRYLNMSYNQLLKSVTNMDFSFLEVLDLSYTSLPYLSDSVFAKLPRLKYLNLSHTFISDFTRQYFRPKVTLQTLDLRGILTQDLDDYLFYDLTISQALYTDLFQICCPQIQGLVISPRACMAPVDTDAISSCANLLGIDIQRFLLWLVAILAVLGNVTIIAYRVIWDKSVFQTGYGLFVTNLGISDFIMGVYLFMIAGADSFYRDSYVLYDKSWRNSVVCKVAGFLACLSCEASTFFIFLITLDRFLVMKFPFGQVKFTMSHKIFAVVISWVASFLLSLVPIVLNFDIHSSNAMCLGLPLTNTHARGWEYSVAVFIIFNLIMFVFVACGQYAIFRAMSKNRISKTATNMPSSRRAEDITVAKQLSLVVLSNFLFWFPVGIMGLMSLGGHEISSQVYAWTTVLLLPINSAANPVLYTIPALLKRWEQFKRGG